MSRKVAGWGAGARWVVLLAGGGFCAAACSGTPSEPAARRTLALATAPSLGTAASFAVLGGETVTNTGPTMVVGNLGVSPGSAVTGFPPGNVSGGMIHKADAVAAKARDDAHTAYLDAAGQLCEVDLTGQDLGGLTLAPGVYCFSSSAQLTGDLVLDTGGNPDAVFVFQIGSQLTTATDSSVSVLGAGGCNVYWQIGSTATLGVRTRFAGTILALTSISLATGATVDGRALAHTGAVTLDSNAVAATGCMGAMCDGRTVDTKSDRNNCGQCGNVCAQDEACVDSCCVPICPPEDRPISPTLEKKS